MTSNLLTLCLQNSPAYTTLSSDVLVAPVTGKAFYLAQGLSPMHLLDVQFCQDSLIHKPAYIRPLGCATQLSAACLSKNLTLAEELLEKTPFQAASITLSADSNQLLVVMNSLLSPEEQRLLQSTIRQGRIQLCIAPSQEGASPHFRLEVTIFYDLDTLWSFDIQLDGYQRPDKRVLSFLTKTGIWPLCFYIGTWRTEVQMMMGIEQMYLPPLNLQHLVLSAGQPANDDSLSGK